ncbi:MULTISPECIES: aldehyde dehydrogenase family protein [unclassified Pseudonocardia]|uniref:aldehyde dehydrogenase family protein n=1 Tax=unclassified Pseudonocardia TaxID=2619320 RepID=UPI0001FFDDFE|nr:aldehyde dehydrogenase family protein [Pseudonocardia sp. Ae707_Ps1]OLM16766.1 Aldehyde dehydrogenase [Pseudonocardia sp. Ae707_Ps1]
MTSLASPAGASPGVPAGGAAADAAATEVARLRRTFATGRTRSLAWRRAQLAGIEKLIAECESELAEALAQDLGRSAHYAWLGDFASTAAEAAFARRHLKRWMRRRRTGLPLSMRPGRAFYQYEPLGVVLVIGPWNYPVYLTLGPLVAAVAAGNVAVLKPSEHAPATSAALARLVPRYLDPDAVAVLEGDAATTQALLAQGVDHAFFTGGTEIGKRVMEAAAAHLTPVTLELGGKSPVIVADDADVEVAARRIAWVKLLNSGQTCIAPDYVLVVERLRDRLVDRITATVAEFQRGEPAAQPIVDRRQLKRLAGLLADHGGRTALGGVVDEDAVAIEPTVVVDPDPGSALMGEEIFGPILPVLTVGSVDDAIAFVDARPKPLGLYLFTGSRSVRERVISGTSSGGVVVNHLAFHCLVPQLPFGGVGDSGIGAYHGEWGFQELSHRRAVLAKPAKPDPSLMYPPYTERKKALMRRFF